MNRFLTFSLFSIFFILFSISGEAKKEKNPKKTKKHGVNATKILDSKPVKKIHKRQARRMVPIRLYKKKGFIGEKEDGLLSIRNTDKMSKKEKRKLKNLLNMENRDRNKLYQIISKANKHSKKQKALLRLNMFRSHLDIDPRGTYYFENGQWHKK